MENKTLIRNLIDQTVQGNFDYVHQSISSLPNQLENNVAVKFIIACCNACNSNLSTPNNLNEEDLVKLLKCLLSCIKTPLREHCESYLQSVFYILKLLIEKNSLDCIIQLKELLMPDFMPLVFTEKQSNIHLNICKLLYNVIIRLSNAQDQQQRQSVLKLCCLLCSMYKKAHNVNKLLDSVHNCLLSLINLNVDAEKLLKFYCHCLHSLGNVGDLPVYHLLINNFSCLYTHLLKMEKFQLAETCYQSTVAIIKCNFKGKEYAFLEEILEIVRWMNPVNDNESIEIPSQAHNSLKILYKNFKTTNNLQAICDLISSVIVVMLLYYKNGNVSKWINKSVELHSTFYGFLHDVSFIMSKSPHQCHCKVCSTKTNLNEALKMLDSISGLGRLFILKKTTAPRNYKMDVLRYLEKFTEYVSVLKQNGCPKWRTYWYNAGVHLYSIGLHLQEHKDFEMCYLFMKKFVEVLIGLEGTESEIVEKTYLVSALGVMADAHLEAKDYERCLLMTAFSIVVGSPKDLINRWIKTKVACRESTILDNNDIQELTLVSVCQKHESELARYFPDNRFEIDRKKRIELLVHELNNYKMKWKSKVPMMAAYRDLSQIADSALAAKVFIEIWGDCDLRVHDDLPQLLRNTVKKLEVDSLKNRSVQVKYFLAYLYFLQHKYRVKDAIIKHCDEMERTMNMTKTAGQSFNGAIPLDPNEECDIVSSYDCLKLSRYLQMMKELNKSLDTILEVFTNDLTKLGEKEKLYKLLVKIGDEYSLHSFTAKSLQAYELALRVAKLENHQLHILRVVSLIIELANVKRSSIEKLVEEVEGLTKSYFAEKTNLEELTVYYLSKAEAYFFVDFDTAYCAFRQAWQLQDQFEATNILKARLCLLHHKFIMLPCHFDVEGHNEYSLVRIHQAHNYAVKYYSEDTHDSAYDMKVFFEICEVLVKMYHDMRLPREVRCYGKEVVLLAQKMVIPLRTTSYLYYLANADVNSCRLDDCRVKVDGLSDILNLSKFKMAAKQPFFEKEKFDRAVDNLVTDFDEMVLDVPTRPPRPTSTGSPTFEAETFQVPSFLYHEDKCECFFCTCTEYHQCVLKKTYLHALLYEHEGNLAMAKVFFCGCIKLFDYFKDKQVVYLDKMAKRMPEDLVPLPWNRFLEMYCLILFEYGNFFLRSGKIGKAEDVNRKALDIIATFSLQSIYLYNEILVQKLNIHAFNHFEKDIVDVSESTVEVLTDTATVIKTPESKQSKIVVSPDRSPGHVEKIKMIPKSLKFDLSDEEENFETKKNVKNVVPAFINMAAKTPAPSSSKIKIYTNKSTTKKKKVLADIPPPPKKEVVNVKELDFVVPMSPEAYTPSSKSSSKVDSMLVNRTKLLTEKLKSSSRKGPKVPSIMVTDENGDSLGEGGSKISESRRARVRQNLLSQLEGDKSEEPKGAVRRSARNRK